MKLREWALYILYLLSRTLAQDLARMIKHFSFRGSVRRLERMLCMEARAWYLSSHPRNCVYIKDFAVGTFCIKKTHRAAGGTNNCQVT